MQEKQVDKEAKWKELDERTEKEPASRKEQGFNENQRNDQLLERRPPLGRSVDPIFRRHVSTCDDIDRNSAVLVVLVVIERD